jgi:hypothetical protein
MLGMMSTGSGGSESSEDAGDSLRILLDLALESDLHSSARFGPVAREMLRRLAPRDSAETMLVVQMIATFSRSMFLSRHANKQKNPKWFALYSEECDRTMNLYRKQMQSLADYRGPRRRSFTAIRTANIAGQQVVVSGSATGRSATGRSAISRSAAGGSVAGGRAGRKDARAERVESRSETEKALPVVGQGEGGAAGGDLEGEALGA